jgi:hypothetical protein
MKGNSSNCFAAQAHETAATSPSQNFCEKNSLSNNSSENNLDANLDSIIDAIGVVYDENDMPPVSDEERATAKLQFLVAQILVRDLVLIKMDKSKKYASDEILINELSRILADNVACIAKEILHNDIFKLNVLDILKDFNKL